MAMSTVWSFVLVLVGILQVFTLFQLVRLLRKTIEQLEVLREENRTLSRNLMATIQDSSRSLAVELRDDFSRILDELPTSNALRSRRG